MKKIILKLCSVIFCIALVIQVTFNNNNDCYYDYETEATGLEIPAAYGLWELIMGLLLSAGVIYVADTAAEEDWLDFNESACEEEGDLYLYLERAYNANLTVIEGTGGQEPSESPEPSESAEPTAAAPTADVGFDDGKANRYWDALLTELAEDEVINFTYDEWEAWRMTVEDFVNDAFGHGDYYNILESDADFGTSFDRALEYCKSLYPDVEYFPPGRCLIAKGSPFFYNGWEDDYVQDYLYFALPGTYISEKVNLTYTDRIGYVDGEVTNYKLANDTNFVLSFERYSLTDDYTFDSECSLSHVPVASGYGFCQIPLTAPDVAPYIGDRPSTETITTVPEVEPDPDSEEENKPYIIPDNIPQPMQIPSADQLGDLYDNIQNNPDGAQDAVKALQQDLAIQTDTETDTDDPTPTASAAPDSDFNEKAANYVYDFSDLFPFCIPKDFYNLLCVFNAEAEAPKFEIPFNIDYGDISYHEVFTVDMSKFDSVIKVFRLLCIIAFILMLIWVTRNFIKW